MAGSQLKKLRASLKEAGLTGQTNRKHKGKKHSRKTPNETRRDDKEKVIEKLREEFNPFDTKMSRSKREDARLKNRTVGKPGISKQVGEEKRREQWNLKMRQKNRNGVLIDRRFGEGDTGMTTEEKMLERFTREKLRSSRRSKYNLNDESDDDELTLTHSGQALGFGERLEESEDEEEGDFFSKKAEENDDDESQQEPPRKKTKAEVMQEVIAKSKFYKAQRQKAAAELQEKVSELDDDFMDVMADIREVKPAPKTIEKTDTDKDYDKKVKSVALSGRAAPADRTKTIEEIAQEKKENMERLENARLQRMRGEQEERGADELDDDYWNGSDEDQAAEFGIDEDDEAGDDFDQASSGHRTISIDGNIVSSDANLICPATLEEFQGLIDGKDAIEVIRSIFKKFQPKLGQGNKQKIGVFTTVLIQYTLDIANEGYTPETEEKYTYQLEFLSQLIRDLADKFPEEMLGQFRELILDCQQRIESQNYPKRSDLVLFAIIGRTFSTSDLYHLVVTPTLVILGESLEFMHIDKHITQLFAGIYICDLLSQYERISERFVPEVVNFLERAVLVLVQEPTKVENWQELATQVRQPKKSKFTLSKSTTLPESFPPLVLNSWDDSSEDQRARLLLKTIQLIDRYVSKSWKELDAFKEISKPFIVLLQHAIKYHASNPAIPALLQKLTNITRIASKERVPLTLQAHRPLSIPTFAPKFEENYNPDKKYYDPDRTRQDIRKLQHQLKDERKQTLRDLRNESRFEAREQIKTKTQEYKDYHAKMARIINTIQSQEGAASNAYNRERSKRKR